MYLQASMIDAWRLQHLRRQFSVLRPRKCLSVDSLSPGLEREIRELPEALPAPIGGALAYQIHRPRCRPISARMDRLDVAQPVSKSANPDPPCSLLDFFAIRFSSAACLFEQCGSVAPSATDAGLSRISSSLVTRTAPSRINWCGPADSGLSTRPGKGEAGRPWSSQACRAVIRAPLRCRLRRSAPRANIPLTIRLRGEKFSLFRRRAKGKISPHTAPPSDLRKQGSVFRRIMRHRRRSRRTAMVGRADVRSRRGAQDESTPERRRLTNVKCRRREQIAPNPFRLLRP